LEINPWDDPEHDGTADAGKRLELRKNGAKRRRKRILEEEEKDKDEKCEAT